MVRLPRLLGALILPALLLPSGWRIDLCLFAPCMPEGVDLDSCCPEPEESDEKELQDCCQEEPLQFPQCGDLGGKAPCEGCSIVHLDPTMAVGGPIDLILAALIPSELWTPIFSAPRGLARLCEQLDHDPPEPGASANLPLRI